MMPASQWPGARGSTVGSRSSDVAAKPHANGFIARRCSNTMHAGEPNAAPDIWSARGWNRRQILSHLGAKSALGSAAQDGTSLDLQSSHGWLACWVPSSSVAWRSFTRVLCLRMQGAAQPLCFSDCCRHGLPAAFLC